MKVFELSKEFGVTNKQLMEFFKESGYKVSSHSQNLTDEMVEVARRDFTPMKDVEEEAPVEGTPIVEAPVEEVPKEPKATPKQPRQYNQNDLILCRSVTAGWLGVSGKSGQYYTFTNAGDYQEIEYQDLFALKSRHSRYLFDPLFVIEDQELLENPRWSDLKQFYEEKVFTVEDVDEVLNLPLIKFKSVLPNLPKGLAKTLQVRVATKIENGTFDSLNKIKAIDEVFGTDFTSVIAK